MSNARRGMALAGYLAPASKVLLVDQGGVKSAFGIGNPGLTSDRAKTRRKNSFAR
jgi:hypothetical protein